MPTPRPVVLVVTMGTDYVAPARMPAELSRAGLEVHVLAPRGALASATVHADGIHFFPDGPTAHEWLHVVASHARRLRPLFLLPGDDVTVRTLMWLAVDAPLQMRNEKLGDLTALVVRSLGDPARYVASIDKGMLARVASDAGLTVPPGDAVDDERAAVEVAEAVGYPVIVRPTIGTQSTGVLRCSNAADVRRAMHAMPNLTGWVPAGTRRALVQRVVRGAHANHPAVAWQGRELAGFTRVAVMQHPEGGPGSVSRYAAIPAVASANRRLIEALGVTGFASTEYVVDAATGAAYLIEINRRMTPATHTGARAGVDLAAAFGEVCAGRSWHGPSDLAPGTDLTLALFPQEYLRDPASAWLQSYATDTPWDDPSLVEAMLRIAE